MGLEPFVGEIEMFGFNFAPRGFAFCAGQLLPINQNTALFSLIGTYYGGNGQTTFALPDLRGRVPVNFGQAPGLSSYELGQNGGTEQVTLLQTQMPQHVHTLIATADPGDSSNPSGAVPANTGSLDKEYKTVLTNPVPMNAGGVSATGGNLPHTNLQPYLAINFCIAVDGVFPSRS